MLLQGVTVIEAASKRIAWAQGHIRLTDSSNTFRLTDLEALRILCSGGAAMPKKSQGIIRAKGRCPICKEKFTEIKGIGYICLQHETVPKKVWVDFPWKGQRIRIFSDKTGKPLDTYSRAEEVLKHIHYELTNHTFDPQKYIKAEASKFWTVNLLDKFEEYKLKDIAPSWKNDYRRMIAIARDFFKNTDVRDVKKIDLINYREHCERTFEWSAKTLKNNFGVMRTFFGYVHDDLEMIDKIPPFPEIEVPDAQFRWVGAKDQVELFELIPEAHKPIFAFLMLHGCRPGEARALKCKDVNLENNSITISATFSRNVYRQRRKGKRSKPAVIPIHPEMRAYLEDRVHNSFPDAFVFIHPGTGAAYYETKLIRVWREVRTRAGISKELRLYDASRHSFASQLVNSGASLFMVSKLLGHSSTKMTEKYSHANLDNLRTEVSKISLKKGTVTNLSPRRTDSEKE
jgi:integrase